MHVSAAKRAEQRISDFNRLIDSTDDALVGTDAEFRVTEWSPGAERLYGYTAAEVLGRYAREVASFSGEQSRAELEGDLLDGGRTRTELTAVRKDGRLVDVEMIAVALRDGRGDVTGYLGIHRDISERRRWESELLAAHRRTETILESITDAFVAVDEDWRYTHVNDAALRRMRGRSGRADVRREDVIGAGMWDLFPDAVGTEIERHYRTAMRERRAVAFESFFPPSGEWIEAHAYPAGDGLSIVYRDVSERKRGEREQRLLGSIIENSSDFIGITDMELRPLFLNEAGRRLVGLGDEDVTRTSVLDYFAAADRDFVAEELVPVIAEKGRWSAVTELRLCDRRDGSLIPVLLDAFRIDDSSTGEPIALAGIARDIRDRKRAEQEREARARQQSVIAELGLRALGHSDPQDVMDAAVSAVSRTLEVPLAAVMEILPARDRVLFRAGVGWQEGTIGQLRSAADCPVPGHTIATEQAVIADDLTSDERFAGSPLLSSHGVVSALSVVIRGRHEPFGALGAFTRERRRFSREEVDFMQVVANVISIAYEATAAESRLNDVREAERQHVARDLRERALQGVTRALAQAQAAAPRDELIGTLEEVGAQLRAAINDLRLGEDQDRPLAERLRELVDLQAAMAGRIGFTLDVADGTPDLADHRGTEVMRVVSEALANARRHSGARAVRVAASSSESRLSIAIVDDGAGFDTELRPPVARAGGLSRMGERAATIGARVEVASEPGSGTAVHLGLDFGSAPAHAPQPPLRILLVDDHAAVREAIAVTFEREPGFTVVGQAGSLAEAREMLEGVDVAVLALYLPDGFGPGLIPELHAASPHADALALGAGLDPASVARAVRHGAAGVLDKAARLDEVLAAVRRLRAGDALLSPDEIVELVSADRVRRDEEAADRQAIESLTERELDVLRLLAEGRDSQAIAQRLHISERTERNHVANVLSKLGVHSRLQALVLCVRYGVVEIAQRPR
jgi:PAS domain S-box-containing protein